MAKRASPDTRAKMSKSRTGKTGESATAWKGGRVTFNRRVKSTLQRRHGWFSRVIQRDGLCKLCGSTKRLDAHHIKPLSTIIKQITDNLTLDADAMYHFVINHELVVDKSLENGQTLCRECHKKVHLNWGSHEPKI